MAWAPTASPASYGWRRHRFTDPKPPWAPPSAESPATRVPRSRSSLRRGYWHDSSTGCSATDTTTSTSAKKPTTAGFRFGASQHSLKQLRASATPSCRTLPPGEVSGQWVGDPPHVTRCHIDRRDSPVDGLTFFVARRHGLRACRSHTLLQRGDDSVGDQFVAARGEMIVQHVVHRRGHQR